MDFKQLEEKLKNAPQTANVRLSLKRIADLKPALTYALEEIKIAEVEERGRLISEVLTEEEQEDAKNISIDSEEVTNNEEILDPIKNKVKNFLGVKSKKKPRSKK
tara:strand:+ start:12688 stop:13002 length:315 start_codon:yes stop_codon:yes gene_type:complete